MAQHVQLQFSVDARDTADHRAPPGEADQVGAGAAADIEHPLTVVAVEADQPRQMVQLLEVILVQVAEESGSADRMGRDLQVVDMVIPVSTDVLRRR